MPRTAQQSIPLALSLIIHGGAFIGLMYTPAIRLPRAAESEYKQVIAGKEDKIVWYKFPKELPRVSPRSRPESERLRASVKDRKAIVSSPRNAPKRSQMVWTPAPELKEVRPLESPNLLAIKIPEPPAPRARPFVAPPALPRAEPAKVDVPDAPQLRPAAAAQVADLRNRPLPPKPWVPPPTKSRE